MPVTNFSTIAEMFAERTRQKLEGKGFNEEMCCTELHPAANIIPPMTDEEFSRLFVDIAEHGLRQPLVYYDGQLLDGRSRLMACLLLHERIVRCVELHESADPVAFVVGANFARRNQSVARRKLISTDEYQRRFAGTKKHPRKYADKQQGKVAKRAGRLLAIAGQDSVSGSNFYFDEKETKALFAVLQRAKTFNA